MGSEGRRMKNQDLGLAINGTVLSYRRSRVQQRVNYVLIKVAQCESREQAQNLTGKKVVYSYNTKNNETRRLQGKISRTHGNSGVVRAKFKRNMPTSSFGERCKVLLY